MNSPNSNSSSKSMAAMDDQQFHESLDALLDREMSWMEPGGSADGQLYTEESESMTTMPPMNEESSNVVSRTGTMSQGASTLQNDMMAFQSQSEAPMMSTIKDAFPRLAGSVGQPSPLTARLGTVPLPLTLPHLTTALPQTAFPVAATPVAPSPLLNPTQPNAKSSTTGKRFRSSVSASSAVSEDEEEKMRRRNDRNVREQQRSHKITEQIDFLRDVLNSAKVPFKPNKFSILHNVSRYIEQLQERSATLDAEHKKLLDTITRTNEMVNRHLTQQNTVSDTSTVNDSSDPQPDNLVSQLEDEAMVFVQGLDYKGVFRHCGVAAAVASIDGRFLDCNKEFEDLTGFKRRELIPSEFESRKKHPDGLESSPSLKARKISELSSPSPKNLSMFNVLTRQDMEIVFLAMSDMLKRLVEETKKSSLEPKDYWSGLVKLSRRKGKTVRMNVSLVRSRHGRPRFFNCALTPELKM